MSINSVITSNHLILCHPLVLLSSIFPSIGFFPKKSVLHIKWLTYWSLSFSISPSSQYSGLLGWTDLISLQSKGLSRGFVQHHINSFALNFLYRPTLTSIHDYWKKQNFDQMDLCQQSNVSAFLMCCLGWSQLFFQGASVF